MPVSSRAAGKKRSKQHEPITKVWKDACLREAKHADGSLVMSFEAWLLEEQKQKQAESKRARRAGCKA